MLLAAAFAGRMAWELLAPVVPTLITIGIVLLLAGWLRRDRY